MPGTVCGRPCRELVEGLDELPIVGGDKKHARLRHVAYRFGHFDQNRPVLFAQFAQVFDNDKYLPGRKDYFSELLASIPRFRVTSEPLPNFSAEKCLPVPGGPRENG